MARVKRCDRNHLSESDAWVCQTPGCDLPLLSDPFEVENPDTWRPPEQASPPPPPPAPILRFGFRDLEVPHGETLLGRDSASPIGDELERANLLNVSRKHAVLIREGPRLWIRDYPSQHGTFVGNAKMNMNRYELRNSDIIALADQVKCEVVMQDPDEN